MVKVYCLFSLLQITLVLDMRYYSLSVQIVAQEVKCHAFIDDVIILHFCFSPLKVKCAFHFHEILNC
jgi:hypothetical protein